MGIITFWQGISGIILYHPLGWRWLHNEQDINECLFFHAKDDRGGPGLPQAMMTRVPRVTP